jgi:lipoate-protein ligase A
MSPRMLAWEIVIARNPLGSSFEPITRRICEGVAAGLSRCGAAACYRPPNDIEIGGLKVSGSGGYMEGRSAVLQGAVLIEDDVPAMARALRLGVGELRARVTCLSAALRAPPPIDDVKNRIIEALVQALDRTSVHAQPDPHDLALAEELLDTEIGTDEFTAGERKQLAGNSR